MQPTRNLGPLFKISSWTNYICQSYLYTVATLPWEIQKSFSTVLFIHTSDYLRYLRGKQTVTTLPTTREKCHHTTLQNAKLLHLTEGNVAFLQMLVTLKSPLWVGIGGSKND